MVVTTLRILLLVNIFFSAWLEWHSRTRFFPTRWGRQ
jgi:hypothetical protein